jgi:hypothetical protein
MDPASAIGVASAVITFAQFTFQFIVATKTIRDNASNQLLGFQTREAMINKIQDLASRASFQKEVLDKQERAINEVATECKMISNEIIDLLRRMEPKMGKNGQYSWYESLKGAAKELFMKGKLDKLQEDLRACIEMLLQQRIFSDRYSTLLLPCLDADCSRLIWTSSSENRKMLESLQARGVPLNQATLDQISAMFRRSIEQLEAANQQRIVNALKFDMMDGRYQTVSDAAKETFGWIFEDQEPQPLPNSPPFVPFKKWLANESGIFHISGKPGSGKSTLMKFLCEHEETKRQLRHWAAPRELVLAKFFFWHPGASLQRSLLGLSRSLLSHVLTQFPEITASLFPKHWKPHKYQSFNPKPDINFEDCELRAAFKQLVESGVTFKNHRLCFFIDGLDEFEEAEDTQTEFARRLQEWVRASRGGLKICVSSRDLPAFQTNNLRPVHKVKLQDLTRGDMDKFVRQKFAAERKYNEEYFQLLESEKEGAFEILARKVVNKAEGVFLWVALTMKLLCEEINHKNTFANLSARVDRIPSDLQRFFLHILNSIPVDYCKEAYFMLAFATEANNTKAISRVFLYRFFFLRELAANPKDPKFPDVDGKKIKQHLNSANAWLSGRCRGLLELRTFKDRAKKSMMFQDVMFTHRSIPEFLEDHLQRDQANYLCDFDFPGALVKTLFAVVKSVEFTKYQEFISEIRVQLCETVRHFYSLECHEMSIFKWLDALDEALRQRQMDFWPELTKVDWRSFKSHQLLRLDTRAELFISVPHVAAAEFFYEYLTWKFDTKPEILDKANGAELLQCIVAASNREELDLERFRKLLILLFQRGVSPDEPSNCPEDQNLPIWEVLILENCSETTSRGFWTSVEQFLEFGADPPSWFYPPGVYKKRSLAEITLTFGSRNHILVENGKKPLCWQPYCVPPCLREQGGKATLRDFLDHYRFPPKNADAIRTLLDEINQEKSALPIDRSIAHIPKYPNLVSAPNGPSIPKKSEKAPSQLPKSALRDLEFDRLPETDLVELGLDKKLPHNLWSQLIEFLKSPLFPWLLLSTSLVTLKMTYRKLIYLHSYYVHYPFLKGLLAKLRLSIRMTSHLQDEFSVIESKKAIKDGFRET